MIDARRIEEALVRSVKGLRNVQKVTTQGIGERVALIEVWGSAETGNLRAELNLSRLAELLESELA